MYFNVSGVTLDLLIVVNVVLLFDFQEVSNIFDFEVLETILVMIVNILFRQLVVTFLRNCLDKCRNNDCFIFILQLIKILIFFRTFIIISKNDFENFCLFEQSKYYIGKILYQIFILFFFLRSPRIIFNFLKL